MESSFKWESTCWGMLLRIWWEVWIGVTCRQPRRSRESPAIPTLVPSILRKNERKGKVLIFSGSELACSFSPYITAVNASVVGSGPILQENKGNINRMLVKKGKGAKYFYWVLKRTTENEIYLLLMHLIWQNNCTTGFQQKKNATRKIVIWKYCTKLWQPACIVKRHRLWLTDPRICFANLYISLCPSVTIATFLLLLLWCLKPMSFFFFTFGQVFPTKKFPSEFSGHFGQHWFLSYQITFAQFTLV